MTAPKSPKPTRPRGGGGGKFENDLGLLFVAHSPLPRRPTATHGNAAHQRVPRDHTEALRALVGVAAGWFRSIRLVIVGLAGFSSGFCVRLTRSKKRGNGPGKTPEQQRSPHLVRSRASTAVRSIGKRTRARRTDTLGITIRRT